MFKRERDRLYRDRDKVQKELERKRIENDKIFQRKKDFDWMINELFQEGKGEEMRIKRSKQSLDEIKNQLIEWEFQLKGLLHQEDTLRKELNEGQQIMVKEVVDSESNKQLLDVQIQLIDSDIAKMKEGTLISV